MKHPLQFGRHVTKPEQYNPQYFAKIALFVIKGFLYDNKHKGGPIISLSSS